MANYIVDYSEAKVIGVAEINNFTNYYRNLLSGKRAIPETIEFSFGGQLDAIDELFYSYLLLFSQDFGQTGIKLHFSAYSKSFGIARQQVAYLQLYGAPVQIFKGWTENEPSFRNSSEYFPQLLIRKTGSALPVPDFFEPRPLEKYFNEFIAGLSDEAKLGLRSAFNNKELFFDTLMATVDTGSFSGLLLSYYLSALQDLEVLRMCYQQAAGGEPANKSFKISTLSYEHSAQLAAAIRRALSESGFFNLSYTELFLFRILIANDDENSIRALFRSSQDTKSFKSNTLRSQQHIASLAGYVRELSTGLVELAKNAVEHAGTARGQGFGVISARILKDVKINALKYSGPAFENWFSQYRDQGFYFLDINVIDSGRVNVTGKYIENVRTEIDDLEGQESEFIKILRADYVQDLHLMSDPVNPYRISDFLNYRSITLFHQVKRVNARLGLLIFSNLVLGKKRGFIKVYSNDLSGKRPNDSALLYMQAAQGDVPEQLVVEQIADGTAEGSASPVTLLGTCYHFTIPVDSRFRAIEAATGYELPDEPTGTSSSVFKQLQFFRLNGSPSKKEPDLIHIVSEFQVPQKTDKYEKIYEYRDHIIARLAGFEKKIALIDAGRTTGFLEHSSDWMRFLAACQMVDPSLNLIICDMPEALYREIIEVNRLFDRTSYRFWNSRYAVLFYIRVQHTYQNQQPVGLWFNSLLFGETFAEYEQYNREISRYHDNLYRISPHEQLPGGGDEVKQGKGIFFAEGKLLNFELVLRTTDGQTLFEDSVRSLLEVEVHEEQEAGTDPGNYNRQMFFRNLKGYKISRAHFKLGSKIHISDFYYAKRLFYNSFYANRFAFLIADHIFHAIFRKNKADKGLQMTLVGYSNYSELLVSNIRRLLNDWGYTGIRHDVVLENERMLKNAGNIHNLILVIIPISSTFTTSQKIKGILSGILKGNMRVPYPDLNALAIGNRGFKSPADRFADEKINEIYQSFGWQTDEAHNQDPQTICIRHDGDVIKQRYFIGLETDWKPIYNCQYCYQKEVCLLETERNNVTPDMIFGLPVASAPQTERDLYDLLNKNKDSKYLVSHHYVKKGKNHYFFYVRSGVFLTDRQRRDSVVQWLNDDFRKREAFRKDFLDGKRVIIVTPSVSSHSGFVNLVNRELFKDTATVLQFSTSEDCLQNFLKFNGALLLHSRIIFVDDGMSTGRSFHMIEGYIRNVFKDKDKVIDLCITLFNQMGYFEQQGVQQRLDNTDGVRYFAKFNIPPLADDFVHFPYAVQMETYRKLAQKATLDMMQIHFKEEQAKFEPLEIDIEDREPKADLHSLLHFLLYHELFNLFSGSYGPNYEFVYTNPAVDVLRSDDDRDAILRDLVSRIKRVNSIKSFLQHHPAYEVEIEMLVIRIFSEPPFVQYKRIKELVFDWINLRLKVMVEYLILEEGPGLSDDFFHCIEQNGQKKRVRAFAPYHTFKLLLRLSVRLKINYLFSPQVLRALRVLLEKLNSEEVTVKYYEGTKKPGALFPDIDVPVRTDTKKIYASGLTTYYIGLVQEVIIEDEAKAIRLVKNVVQIIRQTRIVSKSDKLLNLRNDLQDPFIQLLRLLVLENTFIFDTFFENFLKGHANLGYTLAGKEARSDNYRDFIKNHLESYILRYRFDALKLMLSKYKFSYDENTVHDEPEAAETDEGLMDAFRKTIYLKCLLRNEVESNGTMQSLAGRKTSDIREKINNMLALLCDILSVSKNPGRSGGAYFTIRYKELNKPARHIMPDDLYTISNYYTERRHALDQDLTGEGSIGFKIFREIQEKDSYKPKTTFEFLLDQGGQWNFRELNEAREQIVNATELQGEQCYRNIFFMRIAEISKVDNKQNEERDYRANPKALLCFYRDPVTEDPPFNLKRFDPKRVRFLLLLREDINRFIKHHLSNDSFMAYVEEKEKENYMYTLNHGIKTYSNAIREPLQKLSQGQSAADFTETKRYLTISIYYVLNKINLLSLVARSLDTSKPMKMKHHKLKDIFKEFKTKYLFILKFKNEDYGGLEEGEKVDFRATLPEAQNDVEVELPDAFLGELIFELVFNIRKHILFDNRHMITPSDPLAIRISATVTEKKVYFDVENNFNFYTDAELARLTKSFNDKSKSHGLNLISAVLKTTYSPVVLSRSADGFLKLRVIFKKTTEQV